MTILSALKMLASVLLVDGLCPELEPTDITGCYYRLTPILNTQNVIILVMIKSILIRSKVDLRDTSVGGGAAEFLRNLSLVLNESGWDVDILAAYSNNLTREVQNRYINSKITYNFSKYPNAKSALISLVDSVRGVRTYQEVAQNNNFDIVLDDVSHLPFYPAHFLTPAETTNSILFHTALFNVVDKLNTLPRSVIIRIIERTLQYLNKPEIICAGSSIESVVNKQFGYSRTEVLIPCIDLRTFEYNVQPTSTEVLYLGSLTKRKNVDCLFAAWRQVEETNSNVYLTIAGAGPEKEGLITKADQLGLENVTFEGYVSEQRKLEFYRNALVFVIPSMIEGYVTTGLEAMSVGSIVVGANTAGIKDYVISEENGYLFELNNPSDLAEKITYVINHSESLDDVATNGRRTAEEHSYERFKQKANKIFSQYINSTHASDVDSQPNVNLLKSKIKNN